MRILYLPNSYSQQRQYEKPANIYPVLLAMEAEWYRKQGHGVNWGNAYGKYDKIISEPEGLPFLELPHPDRTFSHWWEYQKNGNFKYLPGTYIQAARDCWYRQCNFCKWAIKYPTYECREVDDVINEIEECQRMGFKEIFDDSGTFPIGDWLIKFCLKKKHFFPNIPIGCNMRMVDIDYGLMKRAGFRMLLFGLESANQKTLDRINKGTKVEDIRYIIKASEAGLEPHTTVMFGYPWETDQDAINTLKLVWWLLKKGYAKTAQASLYQPTFHTKGYCIPNYSHRKYVKQIYNIWRSPQFWINKLRDIHNINDLKYLWKCIKSAL